MLEPLLVTIHVIANLVWIGSIVTVGTLLGVSAKAENPRAVAQIAAKIYVKLSTPAFVISFLFGLARLMLSASTYMHLHWFHAKLTFAIAVIALHHVIGAKAKRAAKDDSPRSMQSGKSSAILTSALLACASLTVAFVIFQSQLVP
ncbi:MAG: CopD family protein [Polyangiaceae bacterium]